MTKVTVDIQPGSPEAKFDGRTIIFSIEFAAADIENAALLANTIRTAAAGPARRMAAVLGTKTDVGLHFDILINTDESVHVVLRRLNHIGPVPLSATVTEVINDKDLWLRIHESIHRLAERYKKD